MCFFMILCGDCYVNVCVRVCAYGYDLPQHLEDTFHRIAVMKNRPSVLLCDRGTMDGKAYVDDETWNAIMRKGGWDFQDLR